MVVVDHTATVAGDLLTYTSDFIVRREVEIWPCAARTRCPSHSIRTQGLIYASTWNVPRHPAARPTETIPIGGASTGVIARNPEIKPGDVLGHFAAINPLTARRSGRSVDRSPSSAGYAGDRRRLVFMAVVG